jgi:hypothetical protein
MTGRDLRSYDELSAVALSILLEREKTKSTAVPVIERAEPRSIQELVIQEMTVRHNRTTV